MASTSTSTQTPSIYAEAARLWDIHHDVPAAQQSLEAFIRSDPALIDKAIAIAAKEAVDMAKRMVRIDLHAQASHLTKKGFIAPNYASRGIMSHALDWLDYTLHTGVSLRNASWDDIAEEVEYFRRERKKNGQRERFFVNIYSKRRAGTRGPSDVLNHNAITKIAKASGVTFTGP